MRGEAKRKTRGGEKNKASVALPPTFFPQKSTNGGDVKWPTCGIPESRPLESVIQFKESGIPLKIGMWNLKLTDMESGIQYLESRIHSGNSSIHDYVGLPYIEQNSRELNQQRFLATHVNRKWTFCTLEP